MILIAVRHIDHLHDAHFVHDMVIHIAVNVDNREFRVAGGHAAQAVEVRNAQ